jgi:hypothetical protein
MGEGDSSITFWRRRCALQSRSPRWITVAVGVGEDLHLDVPAARRSGARASACRRRRHWRLRGGRRRGLRRVHRRRSHAPGACRGHHRRPVAFTSSGSAQAAGPGRAESRRAGRRPGSPVRRARRLPACSAWPAPCRPSRVMAAAGGPMKTRPASLTGVGEVGALGEEAVARVHGIRCAPARSVEQRIDAQVALGGRWLADAHRLVGQGDMRRQGIGGAVDGHGAVAQGARRADHAAGDFAAVGDEDLVEHGWGAGHSRTQRGARFWR